jgi:hypothetical protein
MEKRRLHRCRVADQGSFSVAKKVIKTINRDSEKNEVK